MGKWLVPGAISLAIHIAFLTLIAHLGGANSAAPTPAEKPAEKAATTPAAPAAEAKPAPQPTRDASAAPTEATRKKATGKAKRNAEKTTEKPKPLPRATEPPTRATKPPTRATEPPMRATKSPTRAAEPSAHVDADVAHVTAADDAVPPTMKPITEAPVKTSERRRGNTHDAAAENGAKPREFYRRPEAPPDEADAPRTTDRSTPTTARTVRYKVKPGDTLTHLAQEHGCTISELAKLNGVSVKTLANLKVGQHIKVPAKD